MKHKLLLLATFLVVSVALEAAVPFRGVVEGYYGRPWGTEGRLSLLKFMGENDMNVFIYGPKDDPYHHSKWREPYPESEMRDFRKLLSAAKQNKVNFYWAIHLGGGFRKGSADDYAALFRKLDLMYAAGFRAFAVFFDDFGGADAPFHAEICNRVQAEFLDRKGDCAPLVMCPNVYWGSGHPYQRTLGEKLDRRVNVMWTGHWICSDIKAEDVRKISADLRRAPFIWWNWPVNDYCRRKVLLGRTYGVDDCEYAGFVANPMENCEANKLALYGVAAWARDPEHFDSVKTWEESFAKLYPNPKIAKAMRIFAEHNSDQAENGHGYRREESVSAAPLCRKAMDEFADGMLSEATSAELARLFKEVGDASSFLLKHLPKDRYDLGWELEGWLEQERCLMGVGILTLKLLSEPTEKGRVELLRRIAKVRSEADLAAERHVEKFRAATFQNDRGNVKRPEVSTRELKPLVEKMLETVLRMRYAQQNGGASFDASEGLAGLTGAKALPRLVASRNGKYAGLDRVLENREIAPGEWFGLSIPSAWKSDYFHCRLGSSDPVGAGIIELSKDGAVWTKLATANSGEEMQKRLDPSQGWRYARYRNTSNRSVTVKIGLFKFDVTGVENPIDRLLREVSK